MTTTSTPPPTSTERLGPVDFGRALVVSGDLDPIYIALHGAALPPEQLRRWLLAYWCFYSAGVASRISEAEGAGFWSLMREADREKWPRGRERRHFRGAASARSVEWLAGAFPQPESAIDFVTDGPVGPAFSRFGRVVTYEAISYRVQLWPAFGPWIAFKVADMLDRLGLVEVRYSADVLSFYEEPVAGARLAAPLLGLDFERHGLAGVVAALLRELSDVAAPPRFERPVGISEVETVLCKWKSHRAGRYPVGLDTREIRHGLADGRWGETARRVAAALPADLLRAL